MAYRLHHTGFSKVLTKLTKTTQHFNGGGSLFTRSFASGLPSLKVNNTPSTSASAPFAPHPPATPCATTQSSHINTPSVSNSLRSPSVAPISSSPIPLHVGTALTVDSDNPLVPIPAFPCEQSALQRLFKINTKGVKERAFFVNDIGILERQYSRWCSNLPRTRPYYAVKCSPDTILLKTMYRMGAGFDCASGEEIKAVLNIGAPAHDIIFANPIKSISDLQYAAKVGVNKMTFDNEAELYKIKQHHPKAELVLRLLPDDSGSVMRFGVKFGAPYVHIESLLKTAHSLGLKVIGTSFHIGSGCFDANSYEKAIALSRQVYDLGIKLGLPKFTIMDIGGGFPGNPNANSSTDGAASFEDMARVINAAEAKYFPPSLGVSCIAEPGRYMATAWSTLFTLVQGKREEPVHLDANNKEQHKRKFLYYINDGVYGSFNCIMFDHAKPEPIPAEKFLTERISLDVRMPRKVNATQQQSQYYMNNYLYTPDKLQANMSARAYHVNSSSPRDPNCVGTFFGPTCDSMDVIAKEFPIEELFVGDWLAFRWSGAYTNAAASTFNGMPKPVVQYCRSAQPSPAKQ